MNTSYEIESAGSGRLKDQPAGERPRERLIERGALALSPAELIAILLRTGLKGMNALDIGKQLIQKFGSLGAMAQATVDELQCVRGIGRDKAVTLVAAFTLASKIAEELQRESPVLTIQRPSPDCCGNRTGSRTWKRSRFCSCTCGIA